MPTKTFEDELNELDLDELKSLLRSNYKRIDKETKQIINSKVITKVIINYIPTMLYTGFAAITTKIIVEAIKNIEKQNANSKNN